MGSRDAVADSDQHVAGTELQGGLFLTRGGNHADRQAARRQLFHSAATAEQIGRIVAGVYISKLAPLFVESREEEGGVAAGSGGAIERRFILAARSAKAALGS